MLGSLGRWTAGSTIVAMAGAAGAIFVDEYKSGIEWEKPAIIDAGDARTPPSDAIVLFDGKDLSAWDGAENWEIRDGYAVPTNGGITSKQPFGDVQVHLEWAAPDEVKGSGQGRGNSGLYLMGKYEVQILDSYENETYYDGQAGSIYKQWPPLVNASRKPGEWQSYDILFTAPRFDDEQKLVKPGYVTVLHNGVVVQNHSELLGGTFYDQPPHYEPHVDKLPMHIQFHGNPVRFRDIWVRELSERTHPGKLKPSNEQTPESPKG
ncbi:MAG: DUF1080 domain-containing protein [Planctomycetota bacterium]|nr:DUF1080 domain-containing protein [Planctomycetota bacterium]